jgi:hypothetical protein
MMRLLPAFVALAVVLGVIASLSPPTRDDSDRPTYELTAARLIIPGCDQLHCFRVLVPWVLGRLPGESLLKWKTYAASCNAAAAIAVFLLARRWGVSRRAAQYAVIASAFGFGSLYALYDPFTSDPLMFLIGPLVLWLLAIEREAVAGGLAALATLAKEFAVVPLYIHAVAQWMEGRRAVAVRATMMAVAAFAVWVGLQVWLRVAYGYTFGGNPSADPLHGGYLWWWYSHLNPMVALFAMAAEFGVLWMLAPMGWRFAPAALRHATLAAMLPAAALLYLQQPDRALWNFHFVVTPLAGLALARVPAALAVATLLAFAAVNLRVGSQLSFMPASRATFGVSLVLGAICCGWLWQHREDVVA